MARVVGRTLFFAFILQLGFIGLIEADVKLRIYLQDGSLKAGNLVTETDSTFVVLTRAGREEVPKNKIMFVNGKTLDQWQARPDKLFQTEILPDDVPNPSFVNDKAAIPVLPKPVIKPAPVLVESREPEPVVAKAQKKEVQPKKSNNTEVKEGDNDPIEKKEDQIKPEASPTPSFELPKKRRVIRTVSDPIASPVSAVKEKPALTVARPPRFSREVMAVYHRRQADKFVKKKEPGRALQELHIATLLNRADPDGFLLLGNLYVEQECWDRAHKTLSVPILKKNALAQQQLEFIAAEQARHKKQLNFLRATTAAGVLGIFPFVALMRIFTKKSPPPPLIVTADDVEEFSADQETPQAVLSALVEQPQVMTEVSVPPMFEPVKPVVELPPFLVEPTVKPVELKPVEIKPVEIKPAETNPVEAKASAQERIDIQEALAQAKKAVQQKMPPVAPVSPAVPAAVPPVHVTLHVLTPTLDDREELIRVAQKTDKELLQAHSWAQEGRYEQARKAYKTALALQSGAIEAMLGLGFIDFMEGRWDSALHYYSQALASDPRSADAHYGLGRVYLETNRPEHAVEEFRQALNIDPHLDDARDTLALLGKAA
jgi:tetratricopeptide (TPR) repeat protein